MRCLVRTFVSRLVLLGKVTTQYARCLMTQGLAVAVATAALACTAGAQDLTALVQGNYLFGLQQDAWIQGMMQQTQAAQQQLIHSFIQQHGPELRSAYKQFIEQTGVPISFEQFVYYYIMSAGGTNVAGGLRSMQANFEGLQQAARTLQQGYDSYNAGWWANQQRLSGSMQRYTEGAIRGNWFYQNPYDGSVYTLPYRDGYYSNPYGSFYSNNGQYYYDHGTGWWTPLNIIP